MTPKEREEYLKTMTARERYLNSMSTHEEWLRDNIYKCKERISFHKLWIDQKDETIFNHRSLVNDYKKELMTYRHELARLKGMDRVGVPKHSFIEEDEDGHLVEYEAWKCPKCKTIVGGDLVERLAYCQGCGRRMLWEKVE